MKTTQSPATDEKTRSLKRTQTVFHLLPTPSCLFSARFSRGGSFFSLNIFAYALLGLPSSWIFSIVASSFCTVLLRRSKILIEKRTLKNKHTPLGVKQQKKLYGLALLLFIAEGGTDDNTKQQKIH